jgi:hypothetical protein
MVGEEGGAESQRLRALGERAEKLERPDTNAPTPTQYNIVVPPVPMWKIRSIARYKRVNYLRKVHEKREVAAAASANTIEGAEETVGEGTGDVTNANKLVIDTPIPPEYEVGYGPPDPMLGLTIANKSMLQNLSNNELLNEMSKMNFNCTLIKNEMTALERFRCNLVWLLEKSTMFKVQRNHSEDGLLLGTKGNPKKRYRSMTSSPDPSRKRPASASNL